MSVTTSSRPPEVPGPLYAEEPAQREDPDPGFQEIANGSSDCIFWVRDTEEGEARFQFGNSAFLQTTGWTPTELCSRSLKECMTPHQYEILRGRHLHGSAPQRDSMIGGLKGRDGNWIDLDFHTCLVRSLEPLSVLFFCRKLDRRPDADRIAARYYELYDNAMDCTFTLNRHGWIENGNKKFEELTGRRTGILEEGLFQIMPGERAQTLIRFLERQFQSQGDPCCQISFTDAEGEHKCFDVTTMRNPGYDHEIIVNIRDVTNLRRLEEEIRESEEKYRSLVEQSRDLIFVLVGEEIVFANSLLQSIAGIPQNANMIWKEYIGRFALRQDRSRVLAFFNRAARQDLDRKSSIEFNIKDNDGNIRDIRLTMDTINYQGRKAQIGVARDVTERKKLEQKTKETEKLGTLAQFTASVAHEIRNPLEGLTSAALLLLRSLDVQGENRQLLEVIRNTANEISSTINDFDAMIHKPKYSYSDIDIRSLVGGAVRTVEQWKGYDPLIQFETRFARGVQAVQGDEVLLRKALVNILCNACQAITGEGLIEIRVAHVQPGQQRHVVFTVRDTGRGIPARILPELYDPFVTSKKRGMGMGLFISKRIIEDHGGSLSVVRTGKTGTTFRFTIPVEPVKE